MVSCFQKLLRTLLLRGPVFQSLDRPQRPQNTPPASMGPLQNAHFRKSTSSFWLSAGCCLSYLLATSKAPSIKRIMGVNNRMSETGFPSGVTTPVRSEERRVGKEGRDKRDVGD